MLNKSLFFRSTVGALVLAAAAVPAIAQARDYDYRDYEGRYDRQYDRSHDRYDQRFAYRPYADRAEAYRYRQWRHMHDRRFDGPRGYYGPAYSYRAPEPGPVVVFRGHW